MTENKLPRFRFYFLNLFLSLFILSFSVIPSSSSSQTQVSSTSLTNAYRNYVTTTSPVSPPVVYVAGPTGPRGPEGARGAQGIQGPQGIQGESGSLDTSNFVTWDALDNQVEGIMDSIDNSIQNLSESLAEQVSTETLNVSGGATFNGDVDIVGASTSIEPETYSQPTFTPSHNKWQIDPGDLNFVGDVPTYIATVNNYGALYQDTPDLARPMVNDTTYRFEWTLQNVTAGNIACDIYGTDSFVFLAPLTVADGTSQVDFEFGSGFPPYMSCTGTSGGFEVVSVSLKEIPTDQPEVQIGARIKIDEDGNFGIGTLTPRTRLDLFGNLRMTGKASGTLTGSIDTTASTTVTGVGTHFTTELLVGDRIYNDVSGRSVVAIASDTSLTVDTPFTDDPNDTSITVIYPLATMRDSSDALKVIINDGGGVGIGAINPQGKLDIGDGTLVFSGVNINHGITQQASTNVGGIIGNLDSTNGGLFQLGISSGDNTAWRVQAMGGPFVSSPAIKFDTYQKSGAGVFTLNNSSIAFELTNGGSTPLLDVLGSGKVGIGTTNPIGSLHVEDVLGAVGPGISIGRDGSLTVAHYLAVDNLGTGASRFGVENSTGGGVFTGTLAYAGVAGTSGATAFQIATNNVARLTVDSAGLVGIGTTGPSYPLTVKSTGNSTFQFVAENSANTNKLVSTSQSSAGHGEISVYNSSGTNVINLTAGGGSYFNTGFNVGIGVTNPSGLFSVVANTSGAISLVTNLRTVNDAGTAGIFIRLGAATTSTSPKLIAFAGGATTDGNGSEIGNITMNNNAVSYNTTSDQRLKENIVPTTLGLEALMQIQVRDFNFIADSQEKKKQGFIAQELYTVYPEAVLIGGDITNPWGVDYGRITPLIIKAVQEMNLNLESIAGITSPLPGSETESFATSFFSNLFTKITTWLADAGNEINSIYANIFNAKEKICVDGECLTKNDIHALLLLANQGGGNDSGEGGESGEGDSSPDTTSPIITLTGESSINLNVGDSYSEQGATATDNVDESIAVIISGSVDTGIAGTYTFHYNASDSSGNDATEVTRTVNVSEPEP